MEESNFTKFKLELVLHSVNKQYIDAVKEWNLKYTYIHDTNCICGKAIKNCCVIQNKVNNKELVVGSTCVKKFLGIENVHLFKTHKIKNKYNIHYIGHIKEKGFISNWEESFLISLTKFKTVSKKQEEVLIKIHNNVLTKIRSRY